MLVATNISINSNLDTIIKINSVTCDHVCILVYRLQPPELSSEAAIPKIGHSSREFIWNLIICELHFVIG